MSDTTNQQVEDDDAEGHVLARVAGDDDDGRNLRVLDGEPGFNGRFVTSDDADDTEGHILARVAGDDEDDVEGHRYTGPAISGALDPSGDDVRSAHKM